VVVPLTRPIAVSIIGLAGPCQAYPKIRGTGVKVKVQGLRRRSDFDRAQIQRVVLDVFGCHLTGIARIRRWRLVSASRRRRRIRRFGFWMRVSKAHNNAAVAYVVVQGDDGDASSKHVSSSCVHQWRCRISLAPGIVWRKSKVLLWWSQSHLACYEHICSGTVFTRVSHICSWRIRRTSFHCECILGCGE